MVRADYILTALKAGMSVRKACVLWLLVAVVVLSTLPTFSFNVSIWPREAVIDATTSNLQSFVLRTVRYALGSRCPHRRVALPPAWLEIFACPCWSQFAAGQQRACQGHSCLLSSVGSRQTCLGLPWFYWSGLPRDRGSWCSAADHRSAQRARSGEICCLTNVEFCTRASAAERRKIRQQAPSSHKMSASASLP